MIAFLGAGGLWAIKNTPLDAIPDLSDVQVIVYTPWMGRNPDDHGRSGDLPDRDHDDLGAQGKFVRGFLRLRLSRMSTSFLKTARTFIGPEAGCSNI